MRSSAFYRSAAILLVVFLAAGTVSFFSSNVQAAPTVYFVFPHPQGAYNSTIIEVNWSVEDQNDNITNEYRLDSGNYMNVGNRTNVTLTGLIDGYHYLDVRCTNGLGQDTEVSVSFWIDTAIPNVQFTHSGVLRTNVDPVMVEWAATDNGSGLDHVETRLNGGPWEDKGNVNRQIVSLGSEGEHIFEVRAFDKSGNQVTGGKLMLLDTIRPELEVVSPLDGSILNTSTLEVVWTGDDQGSGISYYEVQVDSATPEVFYDSGSVRFMKVNDGRHDLRVFVYDLAGNQKIVTSTIEIDTSVPYIVQFYPGDRDVEIDQPIWVSTSEMLVADTVSFNITGVTGNVTVSGGQITFTAEDPLEYGTTYNAFIEGQDRAGNQLGPFLWNFTTTDIGNIIGVVVDPFGNIISGTRMDLGSFVSDRTDGAGEFNISHHAGTYWLNITKNGYLDHNITVTVIAGNNTDIGWVTMEPIPVDTPRDEGMRIITLLVSILVVVFLIFLMVSVYIFRRHKNHGISHDDREQMLEILRHFDVSTRIHEVNCYEMLDIDKKSTSKQVKKAYRKLAAKYHPDRAMHNEGFDEDESHIRMKEINAAKNILMDEEKRDLHDRILKATKRY